MAIIDVAEGRVYTVYTLPSATSIIASKIFFVNFWVIILYPVFVHYNL